MKTFLHQFREAVWGILGRHRVLESSDVKSVNRFIEQCHEDKMSVEDTVDACGLTEHVSPFFSERMACDAIGRICGKYRSTEFMKWQQSRRFVAGLFEVGYPGFTYAGDYFIFIDEDGEFGVMLMGAASSYHLSLDEAERTLYEGVKKQ